MHQISRFVTLTVDFLLLIVKMISDTVITRIPKNDHRFVLLHISVLYYTKECVCFYELEEEDNMRIYATKYHISTRLPYTNVIPNTMDFMPDIKIMTIQEARL
jgi:hypothetical protein